MFTNRIFGVCILDIISCTFMIIIASGLISQQIKHKKRMLDKANQE
ncbi:MAG: hypothetical protein ACK5L6_09635 [Anaerorhabdus sp.]